MQEQLAEKTMEELTEAETEAKVVLLLTEEEAVEALAFMEAAVLPVLQPVMEVLVVEAVVHPTPQELPTARIQELERMLQTILMMIMQAVQDKEVPAVQ